MSATDKQFVRDVRSLLPSEAPQGRALDPAPTPEPISSARSVGTEATKPAKNTAIAFPLTEISRETHVETLVTEDGMFSLDVEIIDKLVVRDADGNEGAIVFNNG